MYCHPTNLHINWDLVFTRRFMWLFRIRRIFLCCCCWCCCCLFILMFSYVPKYVQMANISNILRVFFYLDTITYHMYVYLLRNTIFDEIWWRSSWWYVSGGLYQWLYLACRLSVLMIAHRTFIYEIYNKVLFCNMNCAEICNFFLLLVLFLVWLFSSFVFVPASCLFVSGVKFHLMIHSTGVIRIEFRFVCDIMTSYCFNESKTKCKRINTNRCIKTSYNMW